jgi:AAA domain, putative AbiEii toxin, Type IV TA system
MPYGVVAYPQWSAGVRRVASFAYLIVWAWIEHLQAATLRKEACTDRIVLVVDEIEAHLHPKWQRTILPAILRVAEKLQEKIAVQVFAATHSPLVLASLEPHFDEERDRLFWFDLRESDVTFQPYQWAKHGDVVGWLTSPIFGLQEARSREAEQVMSEAEGFMAKERSGHKSYVTARETIEKRMRKTLPGDDPIWSRWLLKTHGGLPQ